MIAIDLPSVAAAADSGRAGNRRRSGESDRPIAWLTDARAADAA